MKKLFLTSSFLIGLTLVMPQHIQALNISIINDKKDNPKKIEYIWAVINYWTDNDFGPHGSAPLEDLLKPGDPPFSYRKKVTAKFDIPTDNPETTITQIELWVQYDKTSKRCQVKRVHSPKKKPYVDYLYSLSAFVTEKCPLN